MTFKLRNRKGVSALAGRLVRTGRNRQLRLDRDWPWPWARHLATGTSGSAPLPGQARHTLPEVIAYGARCSGDNLAAHRAGEGLPRSRRPHLIRTLRAK